MSNTDSQQKKTNNSNLPVKIKRIDSDLPLPQYQTPGAVGFDFMARVTTTIEPGQVAIIPGNVVVAIPAGYVLMIACRSSTPRKKGLMLANSPGIIDQDYCGPEDEIGIQMYNFTANTVVVERGERVAQGLFIPVAVAQFQEVEHMESASRGGFGSTGGYQGQEVSHG